MRVKGRTLRRMILGMKPPAPRPWCLSLSIATGRTGNRCRSREWQVEVPILQVEVRLTPDWDSEISQVRFDVRKTRYFSWLIPQSPELTFAGLVGDGQVDTRSLLREFLEQHRLEPLAHQCAQVAMHHPRLRSEGRVGLAPSLLMGDAVGQVKITTVGGTVTGLWAAKAATRALLNGRTYMREMGVCVQGDEPR